MSTGTQPMHFVYIGNAHNIQPIDLRDANGRIPFKWRGDIQDALRQALESTDPSQTQQLKRSILRVFSLKIFVIITLGIIGFSLIVSLTNWLILLGALVFSTTGIFVIYYGVLITRYLYMVDHPEDFVVNNLTDAFNDNMNSNPNRDEDLPDPPPVYEIANRDPPAYDLTGNSSHDSNDAHYLDDLTLCSISVVSDSHQEIVLPLPMVLPSCNLAST